jgi:ABC-type uncharacterized transport system ATPase subunit
MAKISGSKSACCSHRRPGFCFIEEPAVGMTDEKTYGTGELLLSLAGKHAIIVIGHDMTFIRQISQGRKVTVQVCLLPHGPQRRR